LPLPKSIELTQPGLRWRKAGFGRFQVFALRRELGGDLPARTWRASAAGVSVVVGLAVILALVPTVVVKLMDSDPPARHGWKLIWHDEFNDDTLNQQNWNARDTASPRNNELQYYTPSHIAVQRGRLRLNSDRGAYRDRLFTSAAVDTYDKVAFTYGRIEVRARLPRMGVGIWPALWMLGTGCHPVNGPCAWPTSGSNEIDIMEAVNISTVVYGDLHYGTTIGTSMSPGRLAWPISNPSARFHIFTVEWEPGGVVRWYVDDAQIGERLAPGHFDTPMYLIMNTAVGGNLPGTPTAETRFPQHFDVDFARIYQRS
jgi:beta-glucanase (GH16 family)